MAENQKSGKMRLILLVWRKFGRFDKGLGVTKWQASFNDKQFCQSVIKTSKQREDVTWNRINGNVWNEVTSFLEKYISLLEKLLRFIFLFDEKLNCFSRLITQLLYHHFEIKPNFWPYEVYLQKNLGICPLVMKRLIAFHFQRTAKVCDDGWNYAFLERYLRLNTHSFHKTGTHRKRN